MPHNEHTKEMAEFEDLWAKLYEHGASEKKKEGTYRYWQTLTEEQREQVFARISKKLCEDKFVQYDPIRAIKENTPKAAREPTNYNRRALPDEPVCIAKWNGSWGTYTVREAREYGMEVKRA